MSFFDLDPQASRNLMDQARLNPINPDDLKPGWFAGTWKAPVTGLASAVNDAALMVGDTATPTLRSLARPIDQMFGGTTIDDYLVREQQKAVDNIKDWAPDPRTTGVVGQVVHSLFNVVPEVLAGGPEVAGILQGYKGFRGGMAEGLDPNTALGKGAIDGLSAWVGLKIPMTLAPAFGAATNVGLGAAANVGTGMATRGATAELLRARGYGDMADQYKVLDSSAIAVDLLLGGGFGALAHYGPGAVAKYGEWRDSSGKKVLPSDVDTALGLNNQLHKELDTAPGIPTDPATRAAHVKAVDSALESLLSGREVAVDMAVTRGDFIENPTATAARTEILRAGEDHLGPEWKVFQAELEKRGLALDDVDTSPVIRVAREPASPDVQIVSGANDFMGAKSAVGQVGGNVKDGALRISSAEVNEASRGKGEGVRLYQSLIDNALSKGLRVFSDFTVEADAVRVYEALKRRGYEVKELPGGVLEDGARYGTDAKQPAFEVTRGNNAGELSPMLSDNPDMKIPTDAGEALPARDVLAQSDAEIASARQDSQAFDAAVACALRG